MLHKIRRHNYYWLLTRAAMIVLLITGFFAALGLLGIAPQRPALPNDSQCPTPLVMVADRCAPRPTASPHADTTGEHSVPARGSPHLA